MDAKSVVRNYLKPAKYVPIIALVTAVLAVVLLACSFLQDKEALPDPVAMQPGMEIGVYASVNAVIASDWLAASDDNTYYALIDTDGNVLVARMSDAEFRALRPLNDYYNCDDPNAALPTPIQVTGMTASLGSSIADLLRQAFEFESTADYYTSLGRTYLNVGETPGGENRALLLLGALFCGLFALIFGVQWISFTKATNASLARLEAQGELENAANELENGQNVLYPKQKAVLTDRFIFSQPTGTALRYADILWCYKRTQRVYFVPAVETLMAGTIEGKMLPILSGSAGKKNAGVLEEAAAILSDRNPNVLLGYTAENNRMYHDWVREAKNSK